MFSKYFKGMFPHHDVENGENYSPDDFLKIDYNLSKNTISTSLPRIT